MRQTFIKTLIELADKDDRIMLLTGDLGFNTFEEFMGKFPKRYINCGVAEQNMIGVAAGLALEGFKPYVYSIIPFITFRCLEQIRNDICYQDLNVKIIGMGSGIRYKNLGFTHFTTEDIPIMSALDNMRIFCPKDAEETKTMMTEMYKLKKPCYMRIGHGLTKEEEEKICQIKLDS